MGLGHDHGPTPIKTAIVDMTLATGGLGEDIYQLAADEESRIVGFSGSKNSNSGFLEVSKSSSANIGDPDDIATDTQTLWVLGGNGDNIVFDPEYMAEPSDGGNYIDWDDDEELHLHTVNNTGAAIEAVIVVYYVEERDC